MKTTNVLFLASNTQAKNDDILRNLQTKLQNCSLGKFPALRESIFSNLCLMMLFVLILGFVGNYKTSHVLMCLLNPCLGNYNLSFAKSRVHIKHSTTQILSRSLLKEVMTESAHNNTNPTCRHTQFTENGSGIMHIF
jgi:hypothetical protein